MNWFTYKLKDEGVYTNSGDDPKNEGCEICPHKRSTHTHGTGGDECAKCVDGHHFVPSGHHRRYDF